MKVLLCRVSHAVSGSFWISTARGNLCGNRVSSPNGTFMDTWEKVLNKVEENVSAQSFNTWFKPISSADKDEANVYLKVPSEVFRDWIINNYTQLDFVIYKGLATLPHFNVDLDTAQPPATVVELRHALKIAETAETEGK